MVVFQRWTLDRIHTHKIYVNALISWKNSRKISLFLSHSLIFLFFIRKLLFNWCSIRITCIAFVKWTKKVEHWILSVFVSWGFGWRSVGWVLKWKNSLRTQHYHYEKISAEPNSYQHLWDSMNWKNHQTCSASRKLYWWFLPATFLLRCIVIFNFNFE